VIKSNPRIEALKSDLAKLKEELSKRRKLGADVYIAELMATPIASKIKMAEATQTEKDFGTAQHVITAVQEELGFVPSESRQTFKNVPSPFEQVKIYVAQAKEAAGYGKKGEAERLYTSIRECFPLLNAEQKKEVMADCADIFRRIKALR
jgi:hypothetical protein